MAKCVFTDDERAASKDAKGLMFAVVIQPPENLAGDGSFYRAGTLTPVQAEDLADVIAATLKKFRTAG